MSTTIQSVMMTKEYANKFNYEACMRWKKQRHDRGHVQQCVRDFLHVSACDRPDIVQWYKDNKKISAKILLKEAMDMFNDRGGVSEFTINLYIADL